MARAFTPDDPALPMHYPGFVFRALCSAGYKAEDLLDGTGLNGQHLADPHFRCRFDPLRRFFVNALERTRDPHLGVSLALQFEPAFIGLPAYAAMNAADFQAGLDVLNRFFFLTFPAVEFAALAGPAAPNGEAAIRLRPKFPFTGIEYFAISSALLGCHALCKAMLRVDQVATRAEATVSAPDGWHAVADKVGFPVCFGAAENRLVYPQGLLARPLPGADPINHARLVALCEAIAERTRFETTAASRVVAYLEGERTLGASLANVAAALGYSERGLRRQLERSGTSYRTLADEVRERRARELLAGSALPIKAIAGAVGFDSASNFARSFKRWTGVAPSAFRDAQRAEPADGTEAAVAARVAETE